jgi:hypothetical protein
VSSVGSVVAQRRRNRQFVALQVAPRTRPRALRDLYRDAGTIRRVDSHADSPSDSHGDDVPEQTTQSSQTSR